MSVLLATAAQAVDWRPAGTTAEGATLFVDFDSVKERHGLPTVWLKILHDADYRVDAMVVRSEARLWAFDCVKQQQALVEARVYDGEDLTGSVVDSYAPTAPYKWRDVTTGTAAGTAMKAVCANR